MKILRQKAFGFSATNNLKAVGGMAALGTIAGGMIGNRIDESREPKPVTKEDISSYRKYLNDNSRFYENLSKKIQDKNINNLSSLSKKDLEKLREGVYEGGILVDLDNVEELFDGKEPLTAETRAKLSKEFKKVSSDYKKSSSKTDSEIVERLSKTNKLLNSNHRARNIGAAIGTGIGLLGGAALARASRQ